MRNIAKHMICTWICAIMLLLMLQPINAVATENNVFMLQSGVQEEVIGTQSIIEKDNTWYFSTFEELKELAAKEYNSYCNASYQGKETLIIKENLTIPDNLSLLVMENEIQIPKNITLHASNVGAKSLIVDGIMEMTNLNITEKLVINGSLKPQGYMNLNLGENAYFSGDENIEFSGLGSINLNYTVKDFGSLKELLLAASLPEKSKGYRYTINVVCDTNLILSESLNIPSNAYIDFDAKENVTVNKDCTLSVEGTITISCSMVVNGTLDNSGRINLDRAISTLDNTLGVLSIAENGKYEGSGVISVPKKYGWPQQKLTEPQEAVPGLDLNEFQIEDVGDYDWELRNVAHLTKLGNPTDLLWGYQEEYFWDEESGMDGVREKAFPGAIKFCIASPFQGRVKISVYKVDGDSSEYLIGTNYTYGSDTPDGTAKYWDAFCKEDLESGTYYFEVTQLGDYVQYRNSDTVRSENYVYVKPEEKMSKCTNLHWDGLDISFDGPVNQTYLDLYEIEFYFTATKDAKPSRISNGYTSAYYEDLDEYLVQTHGEGYYYYRIRALSNNIEIVCNGEWSDMSPAYYITENTLEMHNELDELFNTGATSEQIKETIQAMDTQVLKDVMMVDDSIVNKLAYLEESVAEPTQVVVTDEAYAFEPEQISIIGANLNDITGSGDVTLIIDKPEQEHAIPETYDNSVAVRFSMNLENVENTNILEVPVVITLPVPSVINPDFLTVLHYHTDGMVEELTPYVYKVDGQFYARIVVTGFSDFIMTQSLECVTRISGDTRYETGYKVADTLKEKLGVKTFDAVVIATGKNFADALSGSYLAVVKNAPILLTNGKSDNIASLHNYIRENITTGGTVYILGGEAAVPETVEAIEDYDVVRLSGNSRYDTNLEILKAAGIAGDSIIIATGKSFADSLSASAAKLPILLVKPGASLNDAQKAILDNMNKIYIIGGEGAVSKTCETELKAYGTVERVYGNSRYETSVAVANTFFKDVDEVVVASGKNFPDGLCGGPLAAAMNAPLILTADGKTNAAAEYVKEGEINSGFILGGVGAIGDDSVIDVFELKSADEILSK